MLEPIYRIEFFLDAIVNNTTPPEPIYRVEFYLAKIAGADVEIPEPVYRMEKYLAYLCGEEVELPDPIYRIEYYLAFLCGLNVELPEPIYRVEFWLWDWCGGGGIEKTISGNPIHITDALAKPAQALSVKLEPIQDLHGYDNPWPSGGGVNKLPPAAIAETKTASSGFTVTSYSDGHYHLSKTSSGGSDSVSFNLFQTVEASSGMYFIPKCSVSNGSITIGIRDASNNTIREVYLGQSSPSAISTTGMAAKIYFFVAGAVDTIEADIYPMLADSVLTTWYTYSNECPIYGHTDADVIVSPTLNPLDGTTYPIPLGQTMYGGTPDVLTGVLTVDRACINLADYVSSMFDNGVRNSNELVALSVPGKKPGNHNFISNIFSEVPSAVGTFTMHGRTASTTVEFEIPLAILGVTAEDPASTRQAAARQWFTDNPTQLCYELATPQTIQLTPQQVELLQGENNLWSDGTMTLVYLADGNASDVEALNILLGGRYVNNHGEDEPSDREALDILLGRTK